MRTLNDLTEFVFEFEILIQSTLRSSSGIGQNFLESFIHFISFYFIFVCYYFKTFFSFFVRLVQKFAFRHFSSLFERLIRSSLCKLQFACYLFFFFSHSLPILSKIKQFSLLVEKTPNMWYFNFSINQRTLEAPLLIVRKKKLGTYLPAASGRVLGIFVSASKQTGLETKSNDPNIGL